MAARLAPNLQDYSMKDAVRPLVLVGFRRLASDGLVHLAEKLIPIIRIAQLRG